MSLKFDETIVEASLYRVSLRQSAFKRLPRGVSGVGMRVSMRESCSTGGIRRVLRENQYTVPAEALSSYTQLHGSPDDWNILLYVFKIVYSFPFFAYSRQFLLC